jgi:ankyrin repeat protein
MLNIPDLAGNSLLHIAVEKGQKEAVNYLLDKVANVNLRNKDFHAPIHSCVIHNQPEMLELILSHPNNRADIHLGKICLFFDCSDWIIWQHNFLNKVEKMEEQRFIIAHL